jgi:hypothetical protein
MDTKDMKDKTDEIFEKAKIVTGVAATAVGDFAKAAGEKAVNVKNSAQINFHIRSLNNELNDLYVNLGKTAYDMHNNVPTEEIPAEIINSINLTLAEIEKFKAQLVDLRGNTKCPACGKESTSDSEFCASCGAKLG